MFSIREELRALIEKLTVEEIPYALCGALALAVHGYPRATLDIDLLALKGSEEGIRRCGHACGFTLKAAPMTFAGGGVRIERLSKTAPGEEDLLMLDVLSLGPELESEMNIELKAWQGLPLRTLTKQSLIRLKMLRGSAQDVADIEKLR